MKDGLGNVRLVDQTIEDIKEVWGMERVSSRQIPRDPTVEVLNEVAQAIDDAIRKITPIIGNGILIADSSRPKCAATKRDEPTVTESRSSVRTAIRKFTRWVCGTLQGN